MLQYHTYEQKFIGWETPKEGMSPYLFRKEFTEIKRLTPLGMLQRLGDRPNG